MNFLYTADIHNSFLLPCAFRRRTRSPAPPAHRPKPSLQRRSLPSPTCTHTLRSAARPSQHTITHTHSRPPSFSQAKTKSSKEISSIADMQNFVEAYPQFKKLSGDVSKHVTLLGEINRIVDKECLMEVSQVDTYYPKGHRSPPTPSNSPPVPCSSPFIPLPLPPSHPTPIHTYRWSHSPPVLTLFPPLSLSGGAGACVYRGPPQRLLRGRVSTSQAIHLAQEQAAPAAPLRAAVRAGTVQPHSGVERYSWRRRKARRRAGEPYSHRLSSHRLNRHKVAHLAITSHQGHASCPHRRVQRHSLSRRKARCCAGETYG